MSYCRFDRRIRRNLFLSAWRGRIWSRMLPFLCALLIFGAAFMAVATITNH